MKKNYIALIAGLFLITSCETTGSGSGDAVPTNNYATGESSIANLQAYLQNEVGDRAYFDTDKHNINAAAAFILEAQANWLNSTPGFTIRLEGHCDERGTREYNLALGERRANSAKDYLMTYGISSDRISVLSYGKERPVDAGSNPLAWSKNRRSVTVKAN